MSLKPLLLSLAGATSALALFAASAQAAPTVACTGDPGVANRLDLNVNGTPTYGFYVVPAGTPRGLVVVDHGYSHTPYSWLRHLSDMARRDGVIAVATDYRGTIDSPPSTPGGLPSSRGWQVQEGAEDSIAVARLFDAQCQRLPTIDLYSVSMGGNTAGLAAAARAQRVDGRPLWDYWIDVEGAVNVTETYNEASLVALSGNTFAKNAKEDIEREMGGPFAQRSDVYSNRTVVNRVDDIRAAGLKGVVLVHGAGDGLVPYNQAQEMSSRLHQVGIRSDFFTVGTRGPSSEPGTTLDGTVIGGIDPAYTSPLAGHASESSDTQIVGNTGFDRLAALFNRGEAPCDRAFAVDGTTGSVSPDPATTPPICRADFPQSTDAGGNSSRGTATTRNPLGLPAANACLTRRRFRLSLRAPDRARIVSATVYLDGRQVARRQGHSIHSVLLRNLPARGFKVTVVVITNRHRQIAQTRSYRRCGKQNRRRHGRIRLHRKAGGRVAAAAPAAAPGRR
jgi:hypothetical protein